MKIERKAFNSAGFKVISAAEGVAEMVVSVFNNTDAGNEVVEPGFFAESLARRRTPDGRPKAKGVWGHDWTTPVAKTLDARELYAGDPDLPLDLKDLGGLWVKAQFNLDTQRGKEAFSDLQFGTIDEFSIGYEVIQDRYADGKRRLVKGEWYEWSPVLVGMNAATVLLGTKDANASTATPVIKAVMPFKATAKAPEDEAWSAPALKDFTDKAWSDLTDSEKRAMAAHFTWSAAMPPAAFGDMKLPHHNPAGQVVWNGVTACAARMNQADIPAGDMAAVAKHIAGHYGQFDKEIPQAMQDMMSGGKSATVKGDAALDFEATRRNQQSAEAVQEQRWEISRTLSASLDSIIGDETLDTSAKLAMVRTSIAQYGEAMVGWVSQMLALVAAGVDIEMYGADHGETKGQPYAEQAEAALAAAKALVERSVALAATRQKEGRVLSDANRQKLAGLLTTLQDIAKEIDTLLAVTARPDPAPVPAKVFDLAYLERRLRASGLMLVNATSHN